ncbi:MAG TPA: YegP family protein [Polyangiaceae bacterium]|jgi:uncharacterized protein YegP (UPF0339 family)|nr:YegP family protein [Polyangiaceae bacterium]
MESPKFVIHKSASHFYFQLMAADGEILLNSELHSWRGSAEDGVTAVKTLALLDERYERRSSAENRWYFVLKGASGQVIGTSEMYASPSARDEGIAAVKRSAPAAGFEVSRYR